MNYLIGVDIGTTGIKAVAFDARTRPLARHNVGCTFVDAPDPLHREQDPDAIVEAVFTVVRAVQEQLRGRPAAVSFSAAMHSLILVGHDGRPLTRCLSWADLRSGEIARTLRDSGEGDSLYRHTGTPIHPMSPLLKIRWFKDNHPELCQRVRVYAGIKEYLIYKLCGRWLTDHSMASTTGLFDIRRRVWHRPALDFAGIGPGQLPEIVDGARVFGGLPAGPAGRMGLPPETPCVAGGSDGCLANLGSLVFEPDHAVITLGTSAAVRLMTPAPLDDPGGRYFNYVVYDDRYVAGGPSNNGGYLLKWFGSQFHADAADGGADPDAVLSAFLREAAGAAPGAAGLRFLPFILGERAPLWDAEATGAFIGIRADHDRAHFRRAVLEGMLFNLRQIASGLQELAGPIRRLHVNGGLAESTGLVQLLADIFNVPAEVDSARDGSARGAAVLALLALGEIGAPEDLLGERTTARRFDPRERERTALEPAFDLYRRTVEAYRRHLGAGAPDF